MDDVVKSALKKVSLFIGISLLCNVIIYFTMGQEKALQYLGAYLIEFSLSMDNLFVFITLFTAFKVPVEYQHRCLTYGIIGAIILRLIFISLGVAIVNSFEWVLYIFGFILILSGIKMFRGEDDKDKDVHDNAVLKLLSKFIPISKDFDGHNFFTKINGKRYATPLFAVLVVIELSDILFAIDSVPAVFSVSTDLIVVYTSNIFAILGLRQLYFVLEHLHERFKYVKYGVATILTFTGVKLALLIVGWHIPILASIGIIVCVLVASIVLSILVTSRQEKAKANAK